MVTKSPRKDIFKKYNQLVNVDGGSVGGGQTMDKICNSKESGFQLQPHQNFLKQWTIDNPAWTKLLLFHEIGSGKTCTSIVMAEQFLKASPQNKITVILPARLRLNFINELMTPCSGGDRYISKKDYEMYISENVSNVVKMGIYRKFRASMKKYYEIYSFEAFRASLRRSGGLDIWVENMTKNRMVIVDEAHNLFTQTYPSDLWTAYGDAKDPRLLAQGGVKNIRNASVPGENFTGMVNFLFRYLCYHAHKTCKILMLTATPVFNDVSQFNMMLYLLNNEYTGSFVDEKDLFKLLKGRISYFPKTMPNAFPETSYENVDIEITDEQRKSKHILVDLDTLEGEDDDKDAFMVKGRQAANSALNPKKYMDRIIADPAKYAPKINAIVNDIETSRGKHVVYSSFVEYGVNIVKAILDARGWVNVQNTLKTPKGPTGSKVYAVFDSSMNDDSKQKTLARLNDADNIDGRRVRVVLGSPSIREGVSFKHVQYLHLLDPVWNQASRTQIEGRVSRYCSHVDIPANHPFLKRAVTNKSYTLYNDDNPEDLLKLKTCDQYIYQTVIPSKLEMVNYIDSLLRKVSIDYFMFRHIYTHHKFGTFVSTRKVAGAVDEHEAARAKLQKGFKPIKSKPPTSKTCPPKRRLDKYGNCPTGMEPLLNKHGVPCCYKKGLGRAPPQPPPPSPIAAAVVPLSEKVKPQRQKSPSSSCPPKRRLDKNGNCPTGMGPLLNKHGAPCCYKTKSPKRK